MLKTVKVRLYPTPEQEYLLAKAMGSVRWFWNYSLNLTNETYKATGKGLSRNQIQVMLPVLKKQEDTEWLTETYSQCLQVVALNLSNAFINFFEKRAQFPRFKSKHGKQSLSYPQNVKIEGDYLKFPKLGLIYAVFHREIKGSLKTVTITKHPSGQYYASVLFEDGTKKPNQSTEGKAIGIDLGLTDLVVTSGGSKFNNPRWLKKHERNLKIKQQRLSRRNKGAECTAACLPPSHGGKVGGSNNRNRARVAVAKVHNKITRCREDFLHKLSRKIVNENQVICVENLNIKAMVKNHNLAKAINGVGWGMFCTMLKYKSENEGKVYLEVDRFFASSKTCNNCLYQVSSLPLDIRFWNCPNCGAHHDRDINAARNIRDEGLRIISSGTGDKAYCPDVRPNGKGRKSSTIRHSVG
ncbi:MAG: IS200/IS605 family element transposase accessory protein TnpB [Hydrococcus sp. RU_2_2]|nr:IS200/IS605 family element transposase accessory protein TnpB [Hydrococcus sp. RU_2_2]